MKWLTKIFEWLKTVPKKIFDFIKWLVLGCLTRKYRKDKQNENAGRKLSGMKIAVCSLLAFLLLYYAFLMLAKGSQYKAEVYEQQNRTFTDSATRGNIYDVNGKVLATTIESRLVSVSRDEVREYGESTYNRKAITDEDGNIEGYEEVSDEVAEQNKVLYQEYVAECLAEFLDLDVESTKETIKIEKNYWNAKTDITIELGDEIKAWIEENDIEGVYVQSDTTRYYPYEYTACHVLGFTGTDGKGLSGGVELALDETLSGTDGKTLATVEKNGNKIDGKEVTVLQEKQDGYNVNLTIDVNIQKIAEEALNDEVECFGALEGGCVIIMRPSDGSILAMASNPTFNLNDPLNTEELQTKIDSGSYFWRDMWEYNQKKTAGTLTEDDTEPDIYSTFLWRNKAINATYEPGSTFKAITAAIAIEEGVVSETTEVDDSPLELAGWTIHCSTSLTEGGHGNEQFQYGVANSCNPVMARVALRCGVDTYYKYVRAFGFRNKTNILLSGETVGVIHESPTEIDLACAAFGQRFTITPIQLATAYCAIANGGTLYEPRLVDSITDSEGNVIDDCEPKAVRNVLSESTCERTLAMLKKVVSEDGTGGQAYVAGYRMAGKTGTSQTTTTETDGRYIVSFVAVAPSDDPEIVVLVMLDHPTIGSVSGANMGTRLAAEIAKETLAYLGVERVYSDEDNKRIINVYPIDDFTGKTVDYTINWLKTRTGRLFSFEVVGDGDTVVRQYPEEGVYFCREGTIVLYTDETSKAEMVEVPDVTGMSLGDAHWTLTQAGLNVYAIRDGTVLSQSYEAGTMVEKGTIVTLSLDGNLA